MSNAPAAPAKRALSTVALAANLRWPVDGRVISRFASPRKGERRHKGLDIGAPSGTEIRAAADGLVLQAEEHHGSYGRLVTIDHGGGVVTRYGHNSRNLVEPGQRVEAGDVIALVGRTGNASSDHVHFEVRVEDQALDPLGVLPPAGTAPPAPATVAASQRAPEEPPAGARHVMERTGTRPAAGRALYPRGSGKGPPPE